MFYDIYNFIMYGACVKNNLTVGDDTFMSEEGDIVLDRNLLTKYNAYVAVEPLCHSVNYLGIDFLTEDTVTTIDNLIHIHNQWKDLMEELSSKGIKLELEGEVKIINKAYFA